MSIGEGDAPRPCNQERIVPADGYSIAEWSPDEDHSGGPTQVHLLLPIDNIEQGAILAVRLKSRQAIQQMIDGLTTRRDSVWPPH